MKCTVPPKGYYCTREAGHTGPCAARLVRQPLTALDILWLFIVALFLLLIAATFTACHAQTTAHYAITALPDGSKVYVQDHKATPGAVDTDLTTAHLCDKAFHTATARHVTQSEKVKSCRAYGQLTGCPGKGYELDHLISIELGGSNDITNLWPQPVDAPGVVGYHTKDVVENRAHAAVCKGTLTLKQAQDGISTDWYKFGKANGFIK